MPSLSHFFKRISDFFKNLFKKKKPKERKEEEIKKEIEKPVKELKEKLKKGEIKSAPRVLNNPHITEKATFLQGKNQYVFKVFEKANKQEVKKGIEEVYNVKVESVRMINIPKKPRRLGRTSGYKKGYKKAIIELAKGQSIEATLR